MVRPGVQDLLQRLAKHYEIVVYTASLAKYANPLLDILDPDGHVSARLFREHCAYHSGSYVKDLAALGRSLSRTLIVDNSPTSYMYVSHQTPRLPPHRLLSPHWPGVAGLRLVGWSFFAWSSRRHDICILQLHASTRLTRLLLLLLPRQVSPQQRNSMFQLHRRQIGSRTVRHH